MRLREQALSELMSFLQAHLGDEGAALLALNLDEEPVLSGGRWYDYLHRTHTAVEVLRRSPDAVKDLSADMLLSVLAR